jgi:hypothetical protein
VVVVVLAVGIAAVATTVAVVLNCIYAETEECKPTVRKN